MKAQYPTVRVAVGGISYDVDCRILPPRAAAHAGADSPRFLDPGSPPRVQVLRILRDRVEVTHGELLYFNRREIEERAKGEALQRFGHQLELRRAKRRQRRMHGRTA